ncbi:MAG: MBL fold metallo-hydrolase [Oscillospiraceae bacterium]|nr:MBL fold metallo-hydrolase [Oscillospiraceae bacterium]
MEKKKKKLPFYLAAGILFLAVCLAVWFATQPRQAIQENELLHVYVLAVGQGDSILIQSQNHAMLIDGAEASEGYHILQAIKALHISELDGIILTHPHADHAGGLQTILEHLPVKTLYLPDMPEHLLPTTDLFSNLLDKAEQKKVTVSIPECHQQIQLDDIHLEFLSVNASSFDNLNDASLGCRITAGDFSMFLAGDLSEAGEKAFLEENLVTPVTLYKVSHHGSGSSSGAEFLSALSPKYAAVSCGALNDYGHPSEKCLSRLHEIGCEIYRTDLDGTILFSVSEQKVTIEKNVNL